MSALAIVHQGPPLGSWIKFTNSVDNEHFLMDPTKKSARPFCVSKYSDSWFVCKYESVPEFVQGVLKITTLVSFMNSAYEIIECDLRDLVHGLKGSVIFKVLDSKEIEKEQHKMQDVYKIVKIYQKTPGAFPVHTLARFSLERAIADVRENVVIDMLRVHYLNPNRFIDKEQTILIWAVKRGLIDLIDALLLYPDLNINTQDRKGNTALMVAAKSGEKSVVEKLLNHRLIDPNVSDFEHETAFSKSAEKGHIEVVKVFLKNASTEINTQGKNGKTPLMRAIEKGHKEVALCIIDKIGDLQELTISDKEGNTALMLIDSNMSKVRSHMEEKMKKLKRESEYELI